MSPGPLSVSIHQGSLEKSIRLIFPNAKVYVESRKQSNLKYPTGNYLELDVFIPELHLCFEFQDTYHYISTWYAQRTLEKVSSNDNIKKYTIHVNGITLIEVPCWWDGEVASLVASIDFQKPDLQLEPFTNPISLNPPVKFFPSTELPEVGELMLASFPMDLEFSNTIPHNSWWMGEKYDGIRCCWNPRHPRTAFSRSGNEIALLPSIKASLPGIVIEGEFWFGRGLFSNTFLLVTGNIDFVSWHVLRLVSFDVPSFNFQNKPFEKRYKHLIRRIQSDDPFAVVATRALCRGSTHLNIAIGGVIVDGGEGVILRRVGSFYEHGRSRALVKLKSAFGDKEGLVIAVTQSDVILKLPNSRLFNVPLKNVHIPPPTKGEIVTFSYEIGSRRDLPVNAEIYRIRSDLSWEDVLLNSLKDPRPFEDQQQVFTEHPRGYWNHETMRAFMENIARRHHMDPLDPDTWYTIPAESIYQSKTGRTILHKFKSHHAVLQETFPELSLDSNILLSSWSELKHRRKFFERFAHQHSFDPLVPDNWYSQPKDRIMATKGIRIVLSYHNDNLSEALVDIFPDVELDGSRLPTKAYWSDVSNRQQFFEDYAKEHGFDPLVPKNWYTQSKENIMAAKGATHVMYHHLNSIPRALNNLFPSMHIESSKFLRKTPWSRIEVRRRFFEEYAKANSFDPLVPENWYSQSRRKIMSVEGAKNVMFYHQQSVSRALRSVFPDIGLNKRRLWQQASWSEAVDRRKFFEDFAREHSIDPLIPEQWYSVPRHKIMAVQGAEKVISYHNNSVARALQELFPEIGIDKQRSWGQASWKKRRRSFENYAKEQEFDPLVAENWYLQPRSKIMAAEGPKWVVDYHKGSLSRALQSLFPEIVIDRKKFKFSSPVPDADPPQKPTTSSLLPFPSPPSTTSPTPAIHDLSLLLSSIPFRTLTPLERAVTLVRDYKLSHRRAARACAVGARAVRSALESDSKGRQVGVPGRPMVLSQKQQKEFVDAVRNAVDAKKPLTFIQAQEKCQEIFSRSSSESREHPAFCRDFMKRVLNDHGLQIKECLLGPTDNYLSWLVKYGLPKGPQQSISLSETRR